MSDREFQLADEEVLKALLGLRGNKYVLRGTMAAFVDSLSTQEAVDAVLSGVLAGMEPVMRESRHPGALIDRIKTLEAACKAHGVFVQGNWEAADSAELCPFVETTIPVDVVSVTPAAEWPSPEEPTPFSGHPHPGIDPVVMRGFDLWLISMVNMEGWVRCAYRSEPDGVHYRCFRRRLPAGPSADTMIDLLAPAIESSAWTRRLSIVHASSSGEGAMLRYLQRESGHTLSIRFLRPEEGIEPGLDTMVPS